MNVTEVDNLSKGRVWSGKQAKANGLIDRFGSINDAINIASGKITSEKPYLKTYPEGELDWKKSFSFSQLISSELELKINEFFDVSSILKLKRNLSKNTRNQIYMKTEFDLNIN